MQNLEKIYCKNPQCKSKKRNRYFQTNTILKHLSSSENCKSYYSELELKDLEKKSKKHIREKKSKLQSNIYYSNDQWLRKIDKKINSAIIAISFPETDEEGWKSYKKADMRICNKYKNKIYKISSKLQEKCTFIKTMRMDYWNFWLFNEVAEYLPLTYVGKMEERLKKWRAEIIKEIKCTYKHLKKEIADTVDPCWKYVVHWGLKLDRNEIYFIRPENYPGRGYLKSRKTLQIEFKELWNYIDFRHDNSYELILEKTMSFANEIKSLMIEPYEFLHYNRLKNQYDLVKDIPEEYKKLHNHNQIFIIKHLESSDRSSDEYIITETGEFFPFKECYRCMEGPTHNETSKCYNDMLQRFL